MPSAAENAAKTAAAFVAQLVASMDDLIWLIPFLASARGWHRIKLAVTYFCVIMMMMCFAIGFSYGGRALVERFTEEEDFWNAEKILGLIGGTILLLLALREFIEWWGDRKKRKALEDGSTHDIVEMEDSPVGLTGAEAEVAGTSNANGRTTGMYDDKDSDDSSDGNDSSSDDSEKKSGDVVADIDEVPRVHEAVTVKRIALVAVGGGMEDVAVQTTLLLAGTFEWFQLLPGAAIAAVCAIFIALFAGKLKPLVKVLRKIPVWFIILILAIYTLCESFLDWDDDDDEGSPGSGGDFDDDLLLM